MNKLNQKSTSFCDNVVAIIDLIFSSEIMMYALWLLFEAIDNLSKKPLFSNFSLKFMKHSLRHICYVTKLLAEISKLGS